MDADAMENAVGDRQTDGLDGDNLESDALTQTDEGIMTTVRRDCVSPELSTERKRMMEYIPDDSNNNMFAPVKTLNFSDEDVTHEDIESQDGAIDGDAEQFEGDDDTEATASNLIDLEWMDEGNEYQNMRIIEGHDSSPLEHQILRSNVNYVSLPQQQTSPYGQRSAVLQTSSQQPMSPYGQRSAVLQTSSQQPMSPYGQRSAVLQASPQQPMSPYGQRSAVLQTSSQIRQDRSFPPIFHQFDQTGISHSVFSPLKEDLDMTGRGSPNLYDSLDERDSELGQYAGKQSQGVYQYPIPGFGPPVGTGQDFHGINVNQNPSSDLYSSHFQNFDKSQLNSNTSNMQGLSTMMNASPQYSDSISVTSQSPRSTRDTGNPQQTQEFPTHHTQVIPEGMASWEDVEPDSVNLSSNTSTLMRCSVVGHGVASTRSADSQQRPGNRGTVPFNPRLARTEQRPNTQVSNNQNGIGRGNVGGHFQNRADPSRVAARPRPMVQGSGHPRPVVQGSSVTDLKKVQKIGMTSNTSRPKMPVKNKMQSNDRSLDRISGVGSEGPQKRFQPLASVSDSRSTLGASRVQSVACVSDIRSTSGTSQVQSVACVSDIRSTSGTSRVQPVACVSDIRSTFGTQRVEPVASVSDVRSISGTPPLHIQTSVTSPRIASLTKSPSTGQEAMIGRFKVTEGFGHHEGDDDESVHTDMDELMHSGYKMSPIQNQLSPRSINTDVQAMEDVRSHLQNMLRLSTFADKPTFDPTDSASELLMDPTFKRPFSIHGDVPDLFENFPNYSSTILPELSEISISRHDVSYQPDQSYIREALEKERYRRKHCEKQIHLLNVRLLETQQQLAVAIATDKKKDSMIEQLDKQLATVVEGWKKREREKDEYLKLILKEKTRIEQSLNQQQEMINNFESDMAHTIDELKKEKENSTQAIDGLRHQIEEITRDKKRAEEQYDAERERGSLLSQEFDQLKETRELAEIRAQQLQERLHKEQDDWYKREQDLLATIDDVKEANLKVINMEKAKSDEYQSLAADIEERLRTTQMQNKKLEMDIDVLEREKESVKVEIAIIEAKYETAQRKLEADLHSQMEKEIAEQVLHVQEKMDEMNSEMQDKHRQQIREIHQRHQDDLEHHMQEFHDDAKKKDDDYRQQIQSYEERLKEYRNENTTLKHTKQKLESQRMEVLSKLQYMMQSQWNEAVSLLVSTPQRNSQGLQNTSQMNMGMSGTPEPKTSSPRDGRSHVHTTDSKRNTPPPAVLRSVNEVERYLQSLQLGETDVLQTDRQGFVPQDCNASLVSEVSSTSQPPGPIHSTYEEPGGASHLPEQHNFMNEFFNPSAQLPMHIHGYLVNQPKSLPNQNVSAEYVANEMHAFQNMASLPNPAVMIKPPQQQSRPIKGADTSGFGACQPPPKKAVHRVRRKSAEDQRWPTEPEHDDITVTDHTAYSHSPRHLSRHGMSPPVKQTRHLQKVENHVETLVTDGGEEVGDVVRLDKEYNEISERVAEHESRQEELQHYIKMLLDRPPASEANLPAGVEILESSQEATSELDLNDTAQAAQLNRELKRIQELRDRLNPSTDGSQPEREKPTTIHGSQIHGVLPPEQLSEISRLLDQYRTRGETSPKPEIDDSITQLLDLLQNLPNRQVPSELKYPSSPCSPKNRSRILITSTKKTTMKSAQTNAARVTADTSRRSDSESEKSYSAPGVRKLERKMTKALQRSRSSAWK